MQSCQPIRTHAPLLLFLVDRKGVFTYADGRGMSVLGLTRSDVVGQSVFDVYRDVPDIAAHVSRLGGDPLLIPGDTRREEALPEPQREPVTQNSMTDRERRQHAD